MAERKEAGMSEPVELDVHTEHCCVVHGCKYGDDDCPVTTGRKPQSFPCEDCADDHAIASPSPAEAERMDLPEEIERAMNEAILAECGSRRICSVNGRVTKGIRCGPCEHKALETALSRLSAAEAGREEWEQVAKVEASQRRRAMAELAEIQGGECCDGYEGQIAVLQQVVKDKNQALDAALARVERLEKALAFYADEQNYRMNAPLDPNSSWFEGNSRARAALSDPSRPALKENTEGAEP